jgi:hypothetical protein
MLGAGLALLAALVVSSSSSPVESPGKKARVASVETRAATGKLALRDPAKIVKSELEQALDGIDWRSEGITAPFEVLAVLAEAESTTTRDRAHARCTLRITVREPGGALLASISGSVRGEDRPEARASLEREILHAAAEKTSSSLPEAIRAARGIKPKR